MAPRNVESGQRNRIESLKNELDELVKNQPAHSLSTSMAIRIETLEEEIADLEKNETNVTGSD